jgi:hypothetical protein
MVVVNLEVYHMLTVWKQSITRDCFLHIYRIMHALTGFVGDVPLGGPNSKAHRSQNRPESLPPRFHVIKQQAIHNFDPTTNLDLNLGRTSNLFRPSPEPPIPPLSNLITG